MTARWFPSRRKRSSPQPDAELLELLAALCSDPGQRSNHRQAGVRGAPVGGLVWTASGIPLIAEHGVWLRRENSDWSILKPMTNDSGRSDKRPSDPCNFTWTACQAALLEEKEFSLALHYRRADPDQASLRAKELLDDLAGFTRTIDVQMFEGSKVIEVHALESIKAAAAMEWLSGQTPGFILGIGDDWTDEDLFRSLPPTAYSVRVGMATTSARYYLTNQHGRAAGTMRELSQVQRAKNPGNSLTGFELTPPGGGKSQTGRGAPSKAGEVQ